MTIAERNGLGLLDTAFANDRYEWGKLLPMAVAKPVSGFGRLSRETSFIIYIYVSEPDVCFNYRAAISHKRYRLPLVIASNTSVPYRIVIPYIARQANGSTSHSDPHV